MPPLLTITGSLMNIGLIPKNLNKKGKNEPELSQPTVIQNENFCQGN